METLFIALVGYPNSGKSTNIPILEEAFLPAIARHASLSQYIKAELQELDPHSEITRQTLTDHANKMREQSDAGHWMHVALEKHRDMEGIDVVIIDGVRNPFELSALKKLHPHHSASIGFEVDLETRIGRALRRDRNIDPTTEAELRQKLEQEDSPDAHGIQIGACMRMVNYTVDASGTPEDVVIQLVTIVRELKEIHHIA